MKRTEMGELGQGRVWETLWATGRDEGPEERE